MDIVAVSIHACAGDTPLAVLMYIGPDVFLPLTSALAVVVGAALMFWQKLVGLVRAIWRAVFKPKS